MDNKDLWNKLVKKLSEKISYPAIKTWFSQSEINQIKELSNGLLINVISVNGFCSEQLKTRYAAQISNILQEITGKRCFLDFSVGVVRDKRAVINNTPLFSPPVISTSKRNGDSFNPNYKFENFVVGKSNNLAYAAACAISQNPGESYNPLFIYGGVGVGKTHLMQAVGNTILTNYPEAKVIYTTCERFTNDFIESLSQRRPSSFRQKYRKAEVLLIDDVQFLSGRESTQEEFFHTFNELYGINCQIVLTCDRHPAEIGRIEERLVSRFLGGLTVDIGQPDLEMRVAILKAKCSARDIVIDDQVFDFLASKIISNARELEGALIKLLSISSVSKRAIDLSLAKEVFSYKKTDSRLTIAPPKVIRAVARHFGLGPADLIGKKRKALLVRPRQIVMFILRDEIGLSLSHVGRLIGGRDHTTIMHGVEKISQLLDVDDNLKKDLITIRQTLVDYE